MKIKAKKQVKMMLLAIVSTIGIVVFSTITDMILYNHDVPKIDYQSFLGEDYNLYLLIGVLMMVSILTFIFSSYSLIKIIVQKRVKKNG